MYKGTAQLALSLQLPLGATPPRCKRLLNSCGGGLHPSGKKKHTGPAPFPTSSLSGPKSEVWPGDKDGTAGLPSQTLRLFSGLEALEEPGAVGEG